MPVKIRFKRVTFGYSTLSPIFKDFNLELPRTRCVIISGANGVGKSTLLQLTAGLLQPQAGKILYDDISFSRWDKADFYHRVSILRQKPEQNIIGINPLEDLMLWILSDEKRIYDDDIRLQKALEDWELADKKHTPVWELSAGEQRRLALAGFCLNKERYWLLDEPLVALDSQFKDKMIQVLAIKKKIRSGMLIVTHNPELFTEIADENWTLLPFGEIDIVKSNGTNRA